MVLNKRPSRTLIFSMAELFCYEFIMESLLFEFFCTRIKICLLKLENDSFEQTIIVLNSVAVNVIVITDNNKNCKTTKCPLFSISQKH